MHLTLCIALCFIAFANVTAETGKDVYVCSDSYTMSTLYPESGTKFSRYKQQTSAEEVGVVRRQIRSKNVDNGKGSFNKDVMHSQ